jgi:hypothetical protein
MERILPQSTSRTDQNQDLALKLKHNGFDIEQHQQIKADILAGRISLATPSSK